MSEPHQKIATLTPRRTRRKRRSNGSGGDGLEACLRAVEESLTAIEATIPHLATKEDIQKLKVWWLCGILAGMVAAAGIAATTASVLIRIFPPS